MRCGRVCVLAAPFLLCVAGLARRVSKRTSGMLFLCLVISGKGVFEVVPSKYRPIHVTILPLGSGVVGY